MLGNKEKLHRVWLGMRRRLGWFGKRLDSKLIQEDARFCGKMLFLSGVGFLVTTQISASLSFALIGVSIVLWIFGVLQEKDQ